MDIINKKDLYFPGNVSEVARDLVGCLLEKKPENRLGNGENGV